MDEGPTQAEAPSTTAPEQPQLGGADYLRLVGIGVAIGIPAAAAALAFLGLVHQLEHVLWHTWPEHLGLDAPPWWMVLGFPVVGALLVWLARTALPGDGGHEPLGGISLAPTPAAYAPSVALAALASLSFGAVLGPEAPLIALGSIVGMVAVRIWKVTGPGERVLSTAGAFSAVSALFGGPVVAGAILLEAGVGLGVALIPVLLPGAVAAAVGYTIVVGVGNFAGIPTGSLSVPDLPAYPNTSIGDLLMAIVVGVALALVVAVVKRLAHRVQLTQTRFGIGAPLVAGALVVGLLALAVQGLGGESSDVLFSGQSAIPTLLAADSTWLVLAILAAKSLAYAVCLGAGFRGGPVFPAIFIGCAATLLLGSIVHMSPTAVVAIGTACGMAAFTRLLFSSTVFALLLVGTAGAAAIPAAVLAAATSWIVSRTIDQRFAPAPVEAASPAHP
jgi:H+/Cl- antiporter ClcA